MAENSRPPVAIRIVRPYETEEQLLEHELETIGKTSVVLIGAHPRPTGVILRFEVTLSSGETVLRGEGRVLAHKENAFRGQSGLTLRFTRLDPKSKTVVDRATHMREARAQDNGSPSRPSPAVDSPIAVALTASTPSPSPVIDQEAAARSARAAAREKANANARANAKRTGPPGGLTPPPAPIATPAERDVDAAAETPAPTPVTSVPGEVAYSASAEPTDSMHGAPPPPPAQDRGAPRARSNGPAASGGVELLSPPPDRAELLERLRDRAAKLPPERVEEILSARPPR